jgi:uncharacterized protein (TIGR03067 family)
MKRISLAVLFACLTVGPPFADGHRAAPANAATADTGGDAARPAADLAFSEAVCAKLKRIQAELSQRKKEPWEGIFSTANPFVRSGFAISKTEGYVSTSRLLDMGSVKVVGDRIQLTSESASRKGTEQEFVLIHWGSLVYLVKPTTLLDFCNSVNAGKGAPMYCYQRVEDFGKALRGLPTVPTEYREYLLAKPVSARVTCVGSKKVRSIPLGETEEQEGILIRVNAGYRDGLRVGMSLYFPDEEIWARATIISIADASANVLVDYYIETGSKVAVGNRVSTSRVVEQAPKNGAAKAVPADKAEATRQDLRKLEGTWGAVSMSWCGRRLPLSDKDKKNERWTFAGNGFKHTANEEGTSIVEGTFAIDASQSPKHLDLKYITGELLATRRCIFAWEGHHLKIAYSVPYLPGTREQELENARKMFARRPGGFVPQDEDDSTLVIVLKRQRE